MSLFNPVFLYVPNLIGYTRIALAFAAFAVAYQNWQMFGIFYGVSQIMDAFDGWAARKLGQSTKFGAVLDQVTDRFSTAALIMIVMTQYKAFYMACIAVVVVDISSHWFHMYAALVLGWQSHKSIPDSKPILKFYYEFPGAMLVAHSCNEIFWMSLCCASVSDVVSPAAHTFFCYSAVIAAPLMAFKQMVNVLQLLYACQELATIDLEAKSKQSDWKVAAAPTAAAKKKGAREL